MASTITFSNLGLPEPLVKALADLGYESPTPIQEKSIPVLLEGQDIVAQAQTGTGKTAAFALPILTRIDLQLKKPQALIIAPTRELAIQVAEAFQSYAKHLKGFSVAPIYGGQDYNIQLRALKRGAQVVVGTPGRVMDHMRRGTLTCEALQTLVLDEGDEMLRMGFVDDVEWILEQIPGEHQTALFSATMPDFIQQIAKRYLTTPTKIHIKSKESTVDTIEQFYTVVSREQKLEALTRFLEVDDTQGVIIFSRTKTFSEELAEKLQARGYSAAALNGDMAQAQRKKVLDRIKNGALDIVVATDVAARGIDVERISHVINYDIPHDTESYVHRIGRTGRAGRKGKALLFISPREMRMLKDIERATRATIKKIDPPSVKEMSARRSEQLLEKIVNVINKSKNLKPYQQMIAQIQEENDFEPEAIAAALAYLLQQGNPLPSYDIESAKTYGGGDPAKRRRRSPPRGGSRGFEKPRRRSDSRDSGSSAGGPPKKRKPVKRKPVTGRKKSES